MAAPYPRIKAGISGAAVRYVLKTRSGAVMDDVDVTDLEYQLDDVTNATVITTRTDVGALTGEGEVLLSATETVINDEDNSEEVRRLTLWVNTNKIYEDFLFTVFDDDKAL